ncbi:MAG: UTP--glucose-1-phosphate uridylyltransferase [Planctomycetota bacterium]
MSLDKALFSRLEELGQSDFLEHYAAQNVQSQERLAAQLERFDLALLEGILSGDRIAEERMGEVTPVPYVAASERTSADAVAAGEQGLRDGKVAFALLAGGQGSRLRWNGPKGTYPIGPAPESTRTLFQILTEKLLKAQERYSVLPPLAVTTSGGTDAAIKAFFETNDCFGYDRAKLRFACQSSLPALDEQDRFMLHTPERIFTSPDGHGGAIRALEVTGALEAWQEAGIEAVVTFQIDNPLLHVTDPDFIGRLLLGGAPIATKIVLKTDESERVGVVAAVGGHPAIVEYSEISEEASTRRDPDGALTFRLGSIAVHAFTLPFLRRGLAADLPLHVAKKAILCLNWEGALCERMGRKYERFLFDLFPAARSVLPVEVSREREFAPVKSVDGADTPAAARAALDAEYRRWYSEAGVAPPVSPESPDAPFDLSPLTAEGPSDLLAS